MGIDINSVQNLMRSTGALPEPLSFPEARLQTMIPVSKSGADESPAITWGMPPMTSGKYTL
jgi:hypothetical protein